MPFIFLADEDLGLKIRSEIKTILAGNPSERKLELAEQDALAMIKQYIGHRYDCSLIFQPAGDPDTRDRFMIRVVIIIMLYQLSTQTGNKDIPEHRKEDYADMLKWLEQVGDGTRSAVLPSLITEENPGDVRIFSHPPMNHKY